MLAGIQLFLSCWLKHHRWSFVLLKVHFLWCHGGQTMLLQNQFTDSFKAVLFQSSFSWTKAIACSLSRLLTLAFLIWGPLPEPSLTISKHPDLMTDMSSRIHPGTTRNVQPTWNLHNETRRPPSLSLYRCWVRVAPWRTSHFRTNSLNISTDTAVMKLPTVYIQHHYFY